MPRGAGMSHPTEASTFGGKVLLKRQVQEFIAMYIVPKLFSGMCKFSPLNLSTCAIISCYSFPALNDV